MQTTTGFFRRNPTNTKDELTSRKKETLLTIQKYGFFDFKKPYTSKGKYRKPAKVFFSSKYQEGLRQTLTSKETAILLTKHVFAKIFLSYKQ